MRQTCIRRFVCSDRDWQVWRRLVVLLSRSNEDDSATDDHWDIIPLSGKELLAQAQSSLLIGDGLSEWLGTNIARLVGNNNWNGRCITFKAERSAQIIVLRFKHKIWFSSFFLKNLSKRKNSLHYTCIVITIDKFDFLPSIWMGKN